LILYATLAQLVADISSNVELLTYGPLGVICAWFMGLTVFMGRKFVQETKDSSDSMRTEIRTLAHRIDGLTRAMLVDTLSRENVGAVSKKFASEMLAKLEAQNQADLTGRKT